MSQFRPKTTECFLARFLSSQLVTGRSLSLHPTMVSLCAARLAALCVLIFVIGSAWSMAIDREVIASAADSEAQLLEEAKRTSEKLQTLITLLKRRDTSQEEARSPPQRPALAAQLTRSGGHEPGKVKGEYHTYYGGGETGPGKAGVGKTGMWPQQCIDDCCPFAFFCRSRRGILCLTYCNEYFFKAKN